MQRDPRCPCPTLKMTSRYRLWRGGGPATQHPRSARKAAGDVEGSISTQASKLWRSHRTSSFFFLLLFEMLNSSASSSWTLSEHLMHSNFQGRLHLSDPAHASCCSMRRSLSPSGLPVYSSRQWRLPKRLAGRINCRATACRRPAFTPMPGHPLSGSSGRCNARRSGRRLQTPPRHLATMIVNP
jgi:hypothetical protein